MLPPFQRVSVHSNGDGTAEGPLDHSRTVRVKAAPNGAVQKAEQNWPQSQFIGLILALEPRRSLFSNPYLNSPYS